MYYSGPFFEIPWEEDRKPVEAFEQVRVRIVPDHNVIFAKAYIFPKVVTRYFSPIQAWDENEQVVEAELHKVAVPYTTTFPLADYIQFAIKCIFSGNYRVHEGSLYPLVHMHKPYLVRARI